MVTILPVKDDWAKAFENIGSGFSQGYMNRSDENALRAAVDKLGPNPSARDLLNAITSTKTHSPAAKQRVLENYLGVEKFEELKQQAREQAEANRMKNEMENLRQQGIETQRQRENELAQNKFEEAKRASGVAEEAQKRQLDLRERELDIKQAADEAKGKKPTKEEIEQKKKLTQAKSALDIIDRMRAIGSKGRLGFGSGVTSTVLGGEFAKDYGEYEQLGKSLIQTATDIQIRNQKEFEVLAHKIYDPTVRDAEREGILDALTLRIMNHIQQSGLTESAPQGKKERPPLSSFQR